MGLSPPKEGIGIISSNGGFRKRNKDIEKLRLLRNMLKTNIAKLLFFKLRFGVKSFLSSYYITRCFEYPFAFNSMGLKAGMKVLDVGSGTSFFPAYLSHRGIKTYCLDVNTVGTPRFSAFLKKKMRRSFSKEKIYYMLYGGEKFPFRDESFDRVFVVSSIEHIEGDGDIRVAREIARVVKKEGKVFISVEFYKKPLEIYVGMDIHREKKDIYKEHVDFVRYYDENTLQKRIIEATGLFLKQAVYYGSERFNVRKFTDKLVISKYFGLISPFLSKVFYRRVSGRRRARCFTAFPSYYSNVVPCIIMEKRQEYLEFNKNA